MTPAPRNHGFLLREDAAIKRHLQGVRVHDGTSPSGGREVPVFFRLPENEARARTYPYITVDLLTVVRDSEREHRGYLEWGADDPYNPPSKSAHERAWTPDLPVPIQLTYQITHFARFVQHDRQMMAAMVTDRLLTRYSGVDMGTTNEVDDDFSTRRLDIMNGPITADSPDPADPNKRIFRKAYTAVMSSEIFTRDINGVIPVEDVLIDLTATATNQ